MYLTYISVPMSLLFSISHTCTHTTLLRFVIKYSLYNYDTVFSVLFLLRQVNYYFVLKSRVFAKSCGTTGFVSN